MEIINVYFTFCSEESADLNGDRPLDFKHLE